MHNAGISLAREYVDAALAFLASRGLMMAPAIVVDAPMLDPSRVSFNKMGKQVGWKPVDSTVTEADIRELQTAIGGTYPALYVDFLQYRHFYELDDAAGYSFLQHDSREWKATLWDQYFALQEPGTLRQQGYIQFAYDLELNPISFDFNNRTSGGQDCAVVRVLDIYQDPAPTQRLYGSFFDLLLALRAAQEQRAAIA
jgi:hypothetical protein